MSDYTLDELRDMAPAFVLGALNADEYATFQRALANSAALAEEVAAYRDVVTHLGTGNELAPSASVRDRFLARIASERAGSGSLPPAAAATPASRPLSVSSGGGGLSTDAVRTVGVGGMRTPAEKPKGDRWWLVGVLGFALAASLLFAVQRNSQVSTLTATLAQRDSILQSKIVQLAQRDSALNTVLEAERNLVLVNLVSAPDNGPGVQFFWNVKQGRGIIHAFRLKPAAAGRTYQLWLIKDGKPVSAKLFTVDADEQSLVWGIDLPTETTGVTAVAVTDEPAGGSPQPTTTPFLVGEIPKALP